MASETFAIGCSLAALVVLQACTTELPAAPKANTVRFNVVVGRTVAIITGERSRMYEPAVRSFEIQNRQSNERFTIEIESNDERFLLPLAPGDYQLIRIQISEGPFMSIAQLNSLFSVGSDPVTYLGIWRFGVDSPKYGRMVSISMVSDEEDRAEAAQWLGFRYPVLQHAIMTTVVPEPAEVQTRLFEVMPYPLYPRYFRRHWW